MAIRVHLSLDINLPALGFSTFAFLMTASSVDVDDTENSSGKTGDSVLMILLLSSTFARAASWRKYFKKN